MSCLLSPQTFFTGTHVSKEVVAVIKPEPKGLSSKSAIADPIFRIENFVALGKECILYDCIIAEPVPISFAPVPVATKDVPTLLSLAPILVNRGTIPTVAIVYTMPTMKFPKKTGCPSATVVTPPKNVTAEKYTDLPIAKLAVVTTQYLQPNFSGLVDIVKVSSDVAELTTTTVTYWGTQS
jgi:hypothetical protein